MLIDRRAIGNRVEQLPTWARIFLRVLFREGPITLAMLVMLGVILGIIPSPYLGKPLEDLAYVHKEQTIVLQQIRDEIKAWKVESPQRRNP